MHLLSPPSTDGRYRKPDASATRSTHAEPPQRQGQPHFGAPDDHNTERGQPPCLGKGQRQAP